MKKQKLKEITKGDIEKICREQEGCATCPLLLSSYKRNIRCMKDEDIKIWDIEKAYKLLNEEFDV